MITIHPVTFISVYDPTSFKDWIFILGGHKKVFDGMTFFQMYFNPIFFASSFEALTQPLMVRNHNICLLFTSVPVETAISIIKKHLEEDKELHQRTAMTVKQISCLLEFCLNTTYFTFQGKMYEQVKGAAMGSPIHP